MHTYEEKTMGTIFCRTCQECGGCPGHYLNKCGRCKNNCDGIWCKTCDQETDHYSNPIASPRFAHVVYQVAVYFSQGIYSNN